MPTIHAGALPAQALLQVYACQGAFTDCYFIDVPQAVSHADYVAAFYCSAVFKAERGLLGWLTRRPASDADAARLARGESSRFSLWEVEARAPAQLLLRDFTGATRSWLMTAASEGGTRLYFGSAVVPRRRDANGQPRFGLGFHAFGGFHRWYSRALLKGAVRGLRAG